ncbi:MAG: 5-formyltetrahydrofolate cyclo-ligase [Glaciecola sp.]
MNTDPLIMSARQALRAELRAKRRALSEQEQCHAQQQLLTQASDFIHNADIIAAYLPNDGEISPQALIDYAWAHNKTVALPVLHPFHPQTLLFVRYTSQSNMTKNKFGIPEPQLTTQDIIPIHTINRIFVPLVGFDDQGNRMGMGGGFYDRTLAPITESHQVGYVSFKISTPPTLIGLAHDVQMLDSIPCAQWDIPMSHILTPQKCITMTDC